MVTENACLKKSVFLYIDMIIKKDEGSEGTVVFVSSVTKLTSVFLQINSVI